MINFHLFTIVKAVFCAKISSQNTDPQNTTVDFERKQIQLRANAYIRLPFYEANLWVFPIAYHRLNMQLRSLPLLSK